MAKRNRAQRNLELKPRQVALVKNLVVGMTITEAARRAGYSRKCPGQAGYQALQSLKLKMPELLNEARLRALELAFE
jgi:phage terminase small subunit